MRYIGPVYELYFCLKEKDVLDTSAGGRRHNFYGLRHPDDRHALVKLQRELDLIRDRNRDAW